MSNLYEQFLCESLKDKLIKEAKDAVGIEPSPELVEEVIEGFEVHPEFVDAGDYEDALKACINFTPVEGLDWFIVLELEDYYPFEFKELSKAIVQGNFFDLQCIEKPTNLLEMYVYSRALLSTITKQHHGTFMKNVDFFLMQNNDFFLDDLYLMLQLEESKEVKSESPRLWRIAMIEELLFKIKGIEISIYNYHSPLLCRV